MVRNMKLYVLVKTGAILPQEKKFVFCTCPCIPEYF